MSTLTDLPDPARATAAGDDARTSPWRLALVLGGVAAALRLVWVATMSRTPKGLTDLTLYPFFAEQLAAGRGYISIGEHPTAYYPPGYPFFLGAIQWVLDRIGLGEHLVLVAGLVQALLGGVAVGAVVLAGDRLGGRRVAFVAGVVMALWPNLIVHSSLMLSETLFIAVFSVTLLALLHAADDDARRWSPWLLGAGVGLGACALIRPQSTALAIPAIALAWALSRMGWRRWMARTATLVGVAFLVILPWTVRNLVVLDGFVLVSTNTGDNLCMGFNPDTTGGFMDAPYCDTGEFYVEGTEQELRRDAEARSRAIDWATSHVGELPGLSIEKMRITFVNDRDGLRALESFGQDEFLSNGTRRALGAVADLWFFAALAGGLIGVVVLAPRAWRDREQDAAPLVLLGVTLSALVVPVLSFADTRFKVPIAPCVAVLAGVAVAAALDRWRPTRPTDPREQTE